MDKKLTCIIQAASAFYTQAEAEPAPQHFEDWLNSLEEPLRGSFREKGFEACKGVLSFRRFVAGRNHLDMEAYMCQHLSPEDYAFWQQQDELDT